MEKEETALFKNILKIFFKVKKSVENVFAGEYRSVFKGTGLEFEEVREYVPGDDIRNIDWKVTARYGKPFIQKFVEERELTLLILLDLSPSLNFGSQKTKKQMAAEITALLAWSAIVNNDRVGMLVFSDIIEEYVKPRKDRHQILKLIREVLTYDVKGKKTDLGKALEYAYNMTNKRAIIFVVSDFLGDGFMKPLKILSLKHDVIPVIISDPWETHDKFPKIKNDMVFEDSESGELFYLSKNKYGKIKTELKELNRTRKENFKDIKLDYVELFTDRPYFKDLFSYFKRRFKKR
ncbi:MAG: DUF58 domain-containing protein [Elusimicrobiota bacterium]